MTPSRPRRLRSPGYSVAEIMVVVGILGILASVGPTLLISTRNFFLTTSARNDIQRDARVSLDTINRMLRQAKGGTVLIDSAGGQGPYSRIRFLLPDSRYCEFRQDGTLLKQVMTSLADTSKQETSVVSRNLVYIAFTFPRSDDPTLVSVSMTMGKSIQLGQRKVLELTIQKIRIMN